MSLFLLPSVRIVVDLEISPAAFLSVDGVFVSCWCCRSRCLGVVVRRWRWCFGMDLEVGCDLGGGGERL
jgi:hypothetical protein